MNQIQHGSDCIRLQSLNFQFTIEQRLICTLSIKRFRPPTINIRLHAKFHSIVIIHLQRTADEPSLMGAKTKFENSVFAHVVAFNQMVPEFRWS